MNTKLLPVLIVGLVVIGGGFYLMKNSADLKVTEVPTQGEIQNNSDVKEFTVEAANFSFSANEIKVSKGDTVKINFKNIEGMHNWVLDEFNAKIDPISAGKEATLQFTADKAGTFEYYCSVGNHRQLGMVGKLIVE